MKTAHAILSPSGSERWMSCSGSPSMEQDQPGEANEYSDEGVAAHALASMCLTNNNDPAAYEGRILPIINGVYWNGDKTALPPKLQGHTQDVNHTFTVNDEMIENVRAYVNSIREYAQGNTLYVEQRVPIDHVTGEEDAEGTSDAIIITADGKELQVHDLKYGMGVTVKAEKNKQGMIYALGALRKYDLTGEIERVRIVIHQPRVRSGPDEWDINMNMLDVFHEHAKQRARAATLLLKVKGQPLYDHLVPSEYACQFCRAKTVCPKLAQAVSETVYGDFTSLDDPKQHENAKLGLPVDDVALLSVRMSKLEMIEDWCKAIRAKADLALRNGEKVPGWKLVVGKKGNRKWRDENAVIELMKKMRLRIEEMYTMKVLTPTKAEAFFKSTPKRWKALLDFITQEPGKPHVAPESDTRPLYVAPNIADDFTAEDGSDLV